MTSEQDKPGETAGVVAPPPLIYGVAILTGGLLHRLLPLPLLPAHLARPLGVPFVGCALALAAWAIVTMQRAGTPTPTRQPTVTIVSHGPFRFTRNPIYLGFTLLQLGIACWYDTVWILVTLLPAVAVIRAGVISREERYLTRRFGEAYTSYAARVRRWV